MIVNVMVNISLVLLDNLGNNTMIVNVMVNITLVL